ncbi:hypothetical protein [Salibacterium sp. K-3]
MNSSKLKSFIIKITILISVAMLLAVTNQLVFQIKPEDIKAAVEELDGAAPFIFLGAFIIRPFTLIPLSIIAVSCSLVFGPVLGLVYIILGTILGAAASFYALRKFAGGGELEENGKKNLMKIKKRWRKTGLNPF